MPGNSIVRTNVYFGTDSADLDKGLADAKAKIKSFADGAKKEMGGGKGLLAPLASGSGLGGVGKLMGAGLVAGIAAGITSKGISAIQGALGTAVDAIRERMEQLRDVGTYAQAFGLSAESWSVMGGAVQAVGGDLKEFIESMGTVVQLVADAENGGERATYFFQRMGISLEDFKKLNIEQKFYTLQDSLAKVGDASERMALAGIAYGTDGMKRMLPLIGKTAEQTKALGAAYEKTSGDIAGTMLAQESLRAAGMKIQNVFDKVVIALAPVASFIGELIPLAVDYLGEKFGGVFGGSVMDNLRTVTLGVVRFYETAKLYLGDMARIAAPFVDAIGVIVEANKTGIKVLLQGISEAINAIKPIAAKLPDFVKRQSPFLQIIDKLDTAKIDKIIAGVDHWGEDIHTAANEMRKWGEEAEKSYGRATNAAGLFFDQWRIKYEKQQRDREQILRNPFTGPIGPGMPKKQKEEKEKKERVHHDRLTDVAGSVFGTSDAQSAVDRGRMATYFQELEKNKDTEQKKMVEHLKRIEDILKANKLVVREG